MTCEPMPLALPLATMPGFVQLKHLFSLVVPHKLMSFTWKCDLLSLASLPLRGLPVNWSPSACSSRWAGNGAPALSCAPVRCVGLSETSGSQVGFRAPLFC